jgi:catechol 2,3-dioxygenase-like lactoylglutathione lyase family enzyme
VVTALISGPKDFFKGFATVTDKLFSEPQSISAPVSDQPKVVDFYDKVLGLPVVHEYFIDDPSFSKLVGTPHKLQLKAKNIGLKRTEPYFGVIHYGLPPEAFKSLRAQAVFPHRGLAGATLFVDHIDDHAREAKAFGVEILSPVGEAALKPYGKVRSLALRAPHGVIHHLIET